MGGRNSKPNHPEIPKSWEKIGEGGNAYIWGDGNQAIKRLKPNYNSEQLARFKREAEILQAVRDEPGLSIVPIHEIRERDGGFEIVMDRLSGSLESVIDLFAGNPKKAARALLQIANTLSALATRERPIHHRDIKPTNLLYEGSEENLLLADFGCAYLAEDERLTPAGRVMGAWAYRPPEYSTERVANITEKGDVFSLGKVFWAMINGERGIVFPGPVWFGEQYDLANIFPANNHMNHAMLVISKACAIDPQKRATLKQLAEMFDTLANASRPDVATVSTVAMQRVEAEIEIAYAQRRASVEAFVRAIHADLHWAINDLSAQTPEIAFWQAWALEADRTPQTAGALVQQVAVHESDASVVNVRFRRMYLRTRFRRDPADTSASFEARIGSEDRPGHQSVFAVTNNIKGMSYSFLLAGSSSTEGRYERLILRQFLFSATESLMQEISRPISGE